MYVFDQEILNQMGMCLIESYNRELVGLIFGIFDKILENFELVEIEFFRMVGRANLVEIIFKR